MTTSANSTPQTNAGKNSNAPKAKGKIGAEKPYVLYFCTQELAETAGLGTEALRARSKQKNATRYRLTVFESRSVMDAFAKAGFTEFYKVVACPENAELVTKYNVKQDNTLVFCAPDGELVACLAGVQCTQTNVLKLLASWTAVYQTWQKTQAANQSAKGQMVLP